MVRAIRSGSRLTIHRARKSTSLGTIDLATNAAKSTTSTGQPACPFQPCSRESDRRPRCRMREQEQHQPRQRDHGQHDRQQDELVEEKVAKVYRNHRPGVDRQRPILGAR